jgi:hypothetical protein
VVDMSLHTVRQGATNPSEIKKLIERGVRVFTRPNLHSKVIVIGRHVIATSANVSTASVERLDEAGCITSEPVAVQRALEFIRSVALEAVLPNYLRECISKYRPPRFTATLEGKGGPARRPRKTARASHADLWFVTGLERRDIPERELEDVRRAEARVKGRRKLGSAYLDEIHYTLKPKWSERLRTGDLIVDCVREGPGRLVVSAPARHLGLESYSRGRGRRRYLIILKRPNRSQEISLTEFRRRVGHSATRRGKTFRRTSPVSNILVADSIRSIWTPSGAVAPPKAKIRKRRSRS